MADDMMAWLLLPRAPDRRKPVGDEKGPATPPRRGIARYQDPYGSSRYVRYVDGEAVAGLQVMSRDGWQAVIAQVYTAPAHRRKGYAAELLARARRDFGRVDHAEEKDISPDGRAWRDAVEARQKNPVLDPSRAAAVARVRQSLATPARHPNPQKVTSAGTSINQLPGIFRRKDVRLGPVNLDIGGGRYDTATEAMAKVGVRNLIYDPYNRSPEHNEAVLAEIDRIGADTVTIANVLNVIDDDEAMEDVIRLAFLMLKPGGKAYFQVYEKNKTGVGEVTNKGYQRNWPVRKYLPFIQPYFETVKVKGDYIDAENPVRMPNPLSAATGSGGDEAAKLAEASDPSTPSATLDRLFFHSGSSKVMEAVARNPNVPASLLREMLEQIDRLRWHEGRDLLVAISENTGLILIFLADPSLAIRFNALERKHLRQWFYGAILGGRHSFTQGAAVGACQRAVRTWYLQWLERGMKEPSDPFLPPGSLGGNNQPHPENVLAKQRQKRLKALKLLQASIGTGSRRPSEDAESKAWDMFGPNRNDVFFHEVFSLFMPIGDQHTYIPDFPFTNRSPFSDEDRQGRMADKVPFEELYSRIDKLVRDVPCLVSPRPLRREG